MKKVYKSTIHIIKICTAIAITQFLVHSSSLAATIVVSTTSETGLSGCTLREAITSINSGAESGCKSVGSFGVDDTIEFRGTLYDQTIYLTSALPTIVEDVTIKGLGQPNLYISGQNQRRVFRISGAKVDISNLSAIQGYPSNVGSHYRGGGILIENGADVRLTNMLVSSSTGSTSGGGFYISNSSLMLVNSTLSGNSGGGSDGGGIDAVDSNITLVDSTVSNNMAWGGNGGGLSLRRTTARIIKSTISGNSADGNNQDGFGGGIFTIDTNIDIVNSTVSGNTALEYGGGIAASGDGEMSIVNSTVSGNSSVTGGGIIAYAIDLSNPPTVTVSNSIVAGNVANGGDELAGIVATFNTNNANIFGHAAISNSAAFSFLLAPFNLGDKDITATSDGTFPANLTALLDPGLSDNGGPTKTHALVTSSPAIDGAATKDCPDEDQRNRVRDTTGLIFPLIASKGSTALINLGGECDIGAVENSPGD